MEHLWKLDEKIKVEMWTKELGMLVGGMVRHGSMRVCKKEMNRQVEGKDKEVGIGE